MVSLSSTTSQAHWMSVSLTWMQTSMIVKILLHVLKMTPMQPHSTLDFSTLCLQGTELRLVYSEVDNEDNATYDFGINGAGLGAGDEASAIGIGMVQWF